MERRQLGRPPSTASGKITVTIAESVKMRASLFSIRHRVPLGQMVEEGLKLFMAKALAPTREEMREARERVRARKGMPAPPASNLPLLDQATGGQVGGEAQHPPGREQAQDEPEQHVELKRAPIARDQEV